MKIIIAGSRTFQYYDEIEPLIEKGLYAFGMVTHIISGCAKGIDEMGEIWASENGIPCIKYPADWKQYGNFAGKFRNVAMADAGDDLLAIWDGKSGGTGHMIQTMIQKKKPTIVCKVNHDYIKEEALVHPFWNFYNFSYVEEDII